MRLLVFAVIFSLLPTLAADKHVLYLADGVRLRIAPGLFYDVSVQQINSRGYVTGRSEDNKCSFVYSRLNGRYFGKELMTAAQAAGIFQLFQIDDSIQLEQVADSARPNNQLRAIYRVTSEGHHDMIYLGTRKDTVGTAVFMLVGTQSSFYRYAPEFNQMISNYDATSLIQPEPITPPMVVTAMALMVLNLGVIGYGFRRMSLLREKGLEDS